jgi:phage protein U
MFAILGDVPFQVVGSPEAFSDSRGYDYAEHRVVQDRPQLQWLADDLVTIQLKMLLHRSFTDPAASLLGLRQAAETHTALPLVFGNGDFRGYFAITKIDTLSRQLTAAGDPFAISVHVALCESPVKFDAAAPPILPFVPIGLLVVGASGSTIPILSATAGVSALAVLVMPTGSPSASLLADDVPVSTIVRSSHG